MHPASQQSQFDILQIFQKAGFNSLTPLQEKLVPLVLKGRDVMAQSAPGTGKTAGYVLPLILGLRGAGLVPQALILVPTREDVGKVTRAVSRFSRPLRDAPAYIPLGELDDARREQRRLEKGAALVAGTAERVIDHIRRGSLDTRELATVVVEEPAGEARADFVKDVQFIFARLSARRQTVLFSTAAGEQDELSGFLRHPVSLDASEAGSPRQQEPEFLVFPARAQDKAETLARILIGRRAQSALVCCSPRTDSARLADTLARRLLRPLAAPAPGALRGRSSRAGESRSRVMAALAAGEADVLIAPPPASAWLGGEEGFAPSHLVYFDLAPAGGSGPGGSRSAAPRMPPVVIALMETGQERELSRLEEAIGVKMKKEDIPADDDVVTGSIDRVLRLLKTEQDKEGLARLRSRIRRQVPLLQRPLFMAYLLRSQLPQGRPAQEERAPAPQPQARREAQPPQAARASRGRFGRSIEAPRPAQPPRPAQTPAGAAGGDFTQLFVSIGRNRRVFARELTDLFTEKLQLGAQELGSVRVFDKYSFVDIAPGRAEEAIAKLSGSEVKGRTITVNYAKKKEEKGER